MRGSVLSMSGYQCGKAFCDGNTPESILSELEDVLSSFVPVTIDNDTDRFWTSFCEALFDVLIATTHKEHNPCTSLSLTH